MFGVGGRVCTRSVGLYVIAENMKINSYQHVVKNLCPQDDSIIIAHFAQ
jgi:hypothetical protein